LNQAGGALTATNFTFGGTHTVGATHTFTGDSLNYTSSARLIVNGEANVQNFTSIGRITVNNGGLLLQQNPTTAAPLTLGGGSVTIVNSGGTIDWGGSGATQLGRLAGGLLVNNGNVTGGRLVVDYGGLARGTGSYSVNPLTINGGQFSPGSSPGRVNVEAFIADAGGSYLFEINDGSPGGEGPTGAGPFRGWDLTTVRDNTTPADSAFFVESTAANPFIINLRTLVAPSPPDVSGLMDDFDPNAPTQWLAFAVDPLATNPFPNGFDSSAFSVNTSGFANVFNGAFSLQRDGHNLFIVYSLSPVPEPGFLLSAVGATLLAVWTRRCRKGSAPVSKDRAMRAPTGGSRVSVAICLATVCGSRAVADDHAWNNSAGGNWNVGANWTPVGPPVAGDNATISTAGAYTVALTDAHSVASVTLNQSTAILNHTGGTFTVGTAFNVTAGTYALNGGTLTLNGGMTTAAGSTINLTSGTWNGAGAAVVNGAFNWSGGALAGSGTVTLTGPIAFTGGGIRTMNGTKTLVLDADSSWSGGNIWIDGGNTFRINSGRVMTNTGNSTFWWATSTGGTYDIQGTFRTTPGAATSFNDSVVYDVAGAVEVVGGTVTVASGATLVGFTSNTLGKGTWRVQNGALAFNGRTIQTIGANAAVVLDGPTATFAALDSLTQNNGVLRVLGGKTFTPTAASVNTAGIIEVGAGSTFGKAVVVQNGGTLRGSGSIAGTVMVQNGGKLEAGASAPGVLTANGVTLVNGAAFLLVLDGATPGTGAGFHSQLTVFGAIDLGGSTLNATLDYSPEFGDSLMIVNNDGVDAVAGLFKDTLGNSLGEGSILSLSGYSFQISYLGGTGNDIVLSFQPVPEPRVCLLLGTAVAAFGCLWRIRTGVPTAKRQRVATDLKTTVRDSLGSS
jgi:hypothetical protein